MIWLLIFLLNHCKDAPSRNSARWLWTWKNELIATWIAGVCWKTKYIAQWHHCNWQITVWEPFCLMGLIFGKTDLTRSIWWDWLFFLFFDDKCADLCRPMAEQEWILVFCAVGNLVSSLLNQSSQSQCYKCFDSVFNVLCLLEAGHLAFVFLALYSTRWK